MMMYKIVVAWKGSLQSILGEPDGRLPPITQLTEDNVAVLERIPQVYWM